jgi:hypothetical protein
MADCITNLNEARSVLHKLQTGVKMASGTINGRSISYTEAQVPSLKKYVRELEAECGETNSSGLNPARRGAVKFHG